MSEAENTARYFVNLSRKRGAIHSLEERNGPPDGWEHIEEPRP